MEDSSFDFDTLAVQAGLHADAGNARPTVPPISPSTTFTYESVAEIHAALAPGGEGYAYGRNRNPTVEALEHGLAALEGAEDVVAFGSGMAAIHTTLLGIGLNSGDAVVAASDLYGMTRTLLLQMGELGIKTHFVDVCRPSDVEHVLETVPARILYFESISNPLVRIPDVGLLSSLARRHGLTSVIDNTFASPYLLRPLELGVDVVVHSATKYLGGHGDSTAGVVATNRELGAKIRDRRTALGGILSPFDAWLIMRGVRTLPLRMGRQSSSALQVARWLVDQEWVDFVYYPGLSQHPQHRLAGDQLGGGFGGMLSFDLKADRDKTLAFVDQLELINPGTSLGDVESLILYPPLASHRGLSPEQLTAAGLGQSLLRLSVGLESPSDLIKDLDRAASRSGIKSGATLATARAGGA